MKNIYFGIGALLLLPVMGSFALPGSGECRESQPDCIKAEESEKRIVRTTIVNGCSDLGYYTRSRSQRNWKTKCKMRAKARSRRTRARKSSILNREKPRVRALKRRVFSVRTRKKTLRVRRATQSRYNRYGKCSPFQKGC